MGGSGAVGEFNPAAGGMPNSPRMWMKIFKSLGIPPEVCAKVLSAAHPQNADPSGGNARDRRELGRSSLAGLQFLRLAQRIANHSPGPTAGAGCRSDKLSSSAIFVATAPAIGAMSSAIQSWSSDGKSMTLPSSVPIFSSRPSTTKTMVKTQFQDPASAAIG